MKSSNIGGQAVMEGVMMRNGDSYAVAVRTQNQDIVVKTEQCSSVIKYKALTRIPFIRGVFNFVDSLVLGMKTLTYSAGFFLEEEHQMTAEEAADKDKTAVSADDRQNDHGKDAVMIGTVCVAVLLAVGLFVGIPYGVSELLRRFVTQNELVLALFEGLFRLLLFVGYVVLIAQMDDIQRVFMYHGAQHKCINCIENGLELNVENVRKSSKQHKRCGTSFLLFVMLISIIAFLFIRVDNPWLRLAVRLLMIPVIAGISYEIIKLAGRSDHFLVNLISKPGMWLQNLTTREPDDSMIEVGIASVEAVFDWRAFENRPEEGNIERPGGEQ